MREVLSFVKNNANISMIIVHYLQLNLHVLLQRLLSNLLYERTEDF